MCKQYIVHHSTRHEVPDLAQDQSKQSFSVRKKLMVVTAIAPIACMATFMHHYTDTLNADTTLDIDDTQASL